MGSGGMAVDCGPPGDPVPATLDTLKLVIQEARPPCNGADCHGKGTMINPLAMPTDDDDTLLKNLTTTMSVECGNIPVVTPGDPSKSALVKLLNGPCGDIPQMPKGCSPTDCNCLPPEYITAITQWVQNGATK
jgi:hypothetical protein